MGRKIIAQGTGGYTIYLPKTWVRKYNFRQGDELQVKEDGPQLIISSNTMPQKIATLTLNETNKKLIRTILSSYYRQGYTKLVLHGESLRLPMLQEIVSTLTGWELIPCKEGYIIEDNVQIGKQSVHKAIIGLFHIINVLYASLESRSETALFRRQAFRARDYAQRVITQQQEPDSYEQYSFVLGLEKIASSYYNLAKKRLNNDELAMLKEFHELFLDLYKVFLKKDSTQAHTLHKIIYKQRNCLEKSTSFSIATLSVHRLYHTLLLVSSRLQMLVMDNE